MLLRNWSLTLREGKREGKGEGGVPTHQVTRSNHGHHSPGPPKRRKRRDGLGGKGEKARREMAKEGKVRTKDRGSSAQRESSIGQEFLCWGQ